MREKKDKSNRKNKQKKQIKQPTLLSNLTDTLKKTLRQRDLKVEERKVTKEDKKAIKITIAIILGLGLILWFLPFTHQFMEDFIFLRF